MKKQKFDDDKTYEIAFKSKEDKWQMWSEIHCMIAPDNRDMLGIAPEDPQAHIKDLTRRMGRVYQAMSLFESADIEGSGFYGWAYGSFLNYVESLCEGITKHLKVSEKK